MLVVSLPGSGGAGGEHNVARGPLSVWSQGDKISPFGLACGGAVEFFTISVPACFPAKLDPAVTETIVSAKRGSLSAGESMIPVVAQLTVAVTPCGEGRVCAPLTRVKDREAHVSLKGQAKRGSWEEMMCGARVPSHMHSHRPFPRDLGLDGGSRG